MSWLLAVEERLAGLKNGPLNQIGSGLALTAVMERPPQAGVTAWVVPLAEVPGADRRSAGPALQKIELTFGVLLAVRSVNDRFGNRGSNALEVARDAVRQELFGWTPPGLLQPCLLGAGELITMENATLWWLDRYTTAVQRRAAQV